MPHARTTVRRRFIDALGDELDSDDYAVYGTRAYARNRRNNVAIVDVRQGDETVDIEVMGTIRTRRGSLFIRSQRSGKEEEFFDELDADEVQILAAINSVSWDDLLEEDPELVNVSFPVPNADGERVVSAIILEFMVEYRAEQFDPETVHD